MQITIENQTFTVAQAFAVAENDEKLIVYDAKNNVIGTASDMQGATAICEQVAWRRKVDDSQKAVDDAVLQDTAYHRV